MSAEVTVSTHVHVPALLANMRSGVKCLQVANTLAYRGGAAKKFYGIGNYLFLFVSLKKTGTTFMVVMDHPN
jgi:hypothetical protein